MLCRPNNPERKLFSARFSHKSNSLGYAQFWRWRTLPGGVGLATVCGEVNGR